MTVIAMILARLAYDETVREIRERNPEFSIPAFESIVENDGVMQYTEECADKVKQYLKNQYTIDKR